jgi:hypothetical protein
MTIERIVQLKHQGQRFTFTADCEPPLRFWRIESAGRIYRSPMEVSGEETPDFFRALADAALRDGFNGV